MSQWSVGARGPGVDDARVDRRVALWLLCLLPVVLLVLAGNARVALTVQPAITAGFLLVRLLLDITVVAFSLGLWRATAGLCFLILIFGHAFTAVMSLGWLLAQPDVFIAGTVLGDTGTRDWLFVIVSLALILTDGFTGLAGRRVARVEPGRAAILTIGVAVGLALVTLAVVAGLAERLPRLVDTGGRTQLLTGLIMGSLLVGTLLLGANLATWRRAPAIKVWASLALGFELAALASGLLANRPYQVAWYGLRVFPLLALLVVLYALTSATLQDRKRVELLSGELIAAVTTDRLTGLPNRAKLIELAAEAGPRPDQQPVVTVFDLDGFRELNDRDGRAFGDRVLLAIAARIARLADHGETAARLGGAEFAILASGSVDDAKRRARRAQGVLGAPLVLEGRTLVPAFSVGVAAPEAGEAVAIDELLGRAGIAVAQARELGSGEPLAYSAEMGQRIREQSALLTRLQGALAHDEIEPRFEPLVDLRSGVVVGAECLARWPQPDGTVLRAAQFIPLAAQSGLLVRLDAVMARRVAAVADRLAADGHRSFFLSMNLSDGDLRDQQVMDVLAGAGNPNIVIEVTEATSVSPAALATITTLRQQGYRIAVDDFGTGFSNLSQLGLLAPDIIKVDRSFSAGVGAGDPVPIAILRAAVAVAQAIGAQVVLEGIETAAERDAALAAGVTIGQGYYWGQAVPESTMRDWVSDVPDVATPEVGNKIDSGCHPG